MAVKGLNINSLNLDTVSQTSSYSVSLVNVS